MVGVQSARFGVRPQHEARPALAAVGAGHGDAEVGAQLAPEHVADDLRVWGRAVVLERRKSP